MSVNVRFLHFILVAAPTTACGPRSGFTIKNTLPPLPNIQLYNNIKDGMEARVKWTSEVSFNSVVVV